MGQRPISYGWVVVGAGALITCVGMGALFSLGIFLKPIEESMGLSRTGISTIALINWVTMGLGSLFWGALSDRRGGRVVVLSGGALLGLGLVLSSQVTALWQLYVTFGAMVGLLLLPPLHRRTCPQANEEAAAPSQIGTPWIIAGIAATIVFIAVLGPGQKLA